VFSVPKRKPGRLLAAPYRNCERERDATPSRLLTQSLPPSIAHATASASRPTRSATKVVIRPSRSSTGRSAGRLPLILSTTGKLQDAQEHLTNATTVYREMDMTYWLEGIRREIKELGSDVL
jgi:hypothetical protein